MITSITQELHDRPITGWRRWLKVAHLIAIWLFIGGCVLQVFFAGLSVFDTPTWWSTHMISGHLVGMLMLVALVLAFVGPQRARTRWLSVLLLVLYAFQYNIATVGASLGIPGLGALHAVNALLLSWTGLTLGRDAWRDIRKLL